MPIVAVFGGFWAILIIVAGAVVLIAIMQSLGKLPNLSWINNFLSWAQRMWQGALNDIGGTLDNVARGAAQFIAAIPTVIGDFADAVASALTKFRQWIQYITGTLIPSVISSIESYVNALVRAAEQYAQALVTRLMNYVNASLASLVAWVVRIEIALQNDINYVESYLTALISAMAQQLFNDIELLRTELVNFIQSIAAQIYHYIATVEASILHYVDSVVNTAIRELTQYAGEIAQYWANSAMLRLATALAAGAAGAVDEFLPNLRTWARDIADAIPGELAGILPWVHALENIDVASVAAAIQALAIAISIPMEFVAECGVKLCKNLGGFGNDLNNLGQGLIFAALFAFTAEAIANPEATARATNEFAVRPFDDIAQGMLALIKGL
ncbi:MAG: hypothetical protein ACREQ5_01650 [Candidatus Dormibacteria bacterium]